MIHLGDKVQICSYGSQRLKSLVVLGGELAVPCNPQSAAAGLNSHPAARFSLGAS